MPPAKQQQKLFPALSDSQSTNINDFAQLAERARPVDPVLHAALLDLLDPISALQPVSEAFISWSASKCTSAIEACVVTGVKFTEREDMWTLLDQLNESPVTFGEGTDAVQEKFRGSKYVVLCEKEASMRPLVDILILDRLEFLQDQGAIHNLRLRTEADIRYRRENYIITGRATGCFATSTQSPKFTLRSSLGTPVLVSTPYFCVP